MDTIISIVQMRQVARIKCNFPRLAMAVNFYKHLMFNSDHFTVKLEIFSLQTHNLYL